MTDEQEQLLTDLETAANEYAERETLRLQKRAALLRRLNTRVDDFVNSVVSTQARLVLSDIDSLLG
jgi:hypothetical protein